MKKYYKFIIIFIALAIYTAFGYFYIDQNSQNLLEERYMDVSNKMKSTLETLIEDKKETIKLISLTLSYNLEIRDALVTNDPNDLSLNLLSDSLKKDSTLKHIMFHIITKEGVSFYRSWTPKRGESILKIRPDVVRMIQEHKPISTISIGKYDMTFKVMVPIFNKQKEFLGAIETVAKFNSIAKKMQEYGDKILVLVDKSYKKQLTKAFNKKFINDYYVAYLNSDAIIEKKFQEDEKHKLLHINHFMIDNNASLLFTTYHLLGFNTKEMGYFILAKNLNDIDTKDIESSNRKIIYTLIVILLIIIAFSYYIYMLKYQEFVTKYNKKLEKDVTERTQKLRHIIELFGKNVIASNGDIHGKITYASQALCDISGYTQEELIGQPHSIFRHKDMPSKIFTELWQTLKAGKVWSGEIKNSKKNGGYYWVSASIAPNYDEKGAIIDYSSIRHDITAQKVKEEFLATMSHELRTPLNSIIGFSQILMLKKDIQAEVLQEYIKKINISGNHLLSLVNNVLDFSKLESDKMDLHLEEINLAELFDEVVIMLESTAEKKNITLVKAYPKDVELTVDTKLLKQVVINIISNAIKFTPEKKKITLGYREDTKSHHLSICDEGIGLTKEQMDTIFTPFSQIREHQKEAIKGTGLGLSISKKIMNLHQGEISVTSQLNEGSCFTLTLPKGISI